MKRIYKLIRSGITFVAKAIARMDAFFEKYRVYSVACIALVVIVSIMLSNSFYQPRVYSNYTRSVSTSIRMVGDQVLRFEFDAKKSRLSSVIFNKDVSKSRLSETDTIELSIYDDEGVLIDSREAFLYHPHRSYVSVNFTGLNLDVGKRYVAEIRVNRLSPSSVLFLKMHSVFTLDYVQSDLSSNDEPLGFSYVPDASYRYSILSFLSMAVHISVIIAAVILLFFERLRKSRVFCEIYRVSGIIMFLYIFTEMLNVARDNSLQFLFPFNSKTVLLITAAMLIMVIVYLTFYMITSHGTLSMLLTSALVFALGYVNHSKIVMRGDPLVPWDIFAAGVAAKCSSQYDFRVTVQFVASFLMVGIILLMIRLTHQKRITSVRARLIVGLLTLCVVVAMTFGFITNEKLHEKMDISYPLYPPLESFNENGTILSFFLHFNNIAPKGTLDNSPELTADIIEKYVRIADEMNLYRHVSASGIKPNVICIMSESYADLRMIRDFETSEPVMPYYDSILPETYHGELQVSIFAGGTSNTEFEFLTGYSVSGLLAGSSVYTFYIKEETDAMPFLFKQNGYKTIALHPFDAEWWDRNRVYPLLGFDEYISQEDFADPELVRRFISDKSAFQRIIDEYEEKESAQPLFAFCVTMQNHADYSIRWDNQKYDIKLKSFEDYQFPFAENYLSLLRESDDALKLLIEYFRQEKEPTIIVFFGDHLATLDHGFYDLLLDTNINQITAEESIPMYSTPYFIWSNYDLKTGYAGLTSPNFLGQTILDLSGIQSPEQRACLRVLKTKISAISALAVFDRDGTPWINQEDLKEEILTIIRDYEKLQYGEIYYNAIKQEEDE